MTSRVSFTVSLFATFFAAACSDSSAIEPPSATVEPQCTPGHSASCSGPDAAESEPEPELESDIPPQARVPAPPTDVTAARVAVATTVTTLAGSGIASFADGTGTAAGFNNPTGVAVDSAGNVYVADRTNHRIRKVTALGVVTTVAGSGVGDFANGAAETARFKYPGSLTVDAAGNIYVGDNGTDRVRKVTPTGVVTTFAGSGELAFADGMGPDASFWTPEGIAIDATGNLYVADQNHNRIRKVTPATAVTTVAGSGAEAFADGTGTAASFDWPAGIALDSAGNVYVGDSGNHRIRKMTPAGVVTTFAGSGSPTFADGKGAAASFRYPYGIAIDAANNLYVADEGNHRIRRVTPTGVVTTLAGSGAEAFADGDGADASFDVPAGVAVDAAGTVYVGDALNHRIRKMTSVGIGELLVTWTAPANPGALASSVKVSGYEATATAAGYPSRSCRTAGSTSCKVSGLVSGIVYTVSVTATNALGTGAASKAVTATPN
jgi:sugar lactone lactonase YvrE